MNTHENTHPMRVARAALTATMLATLLLLVGCGEAEPQAAASGGAKPVPVKLETVSKAPLVLTLALTGTVEAGRIAQLASPAEGPVTAVRVREGDVVTAGQVLLTLGRTSGADALAASLREELKKEEDNLARTRQLVESGALAGEQLDGATASTARIRAQLIKAQETARDYAIAAPWAGVVSKMKVREGDFVAPRAPLIEVYQPQSLLIRLALPEQEAAAVALGMRATVELDAYPGQTFTGRLARLYPYLDSRTRTRTAEIVLDKTPRLLPGMFARVALIKATLADALTIPAHALVMQPGGGTAVFVMIEGKAARRTVKTGAEVDGRIQVTAGLAPGDRLIVAGHERLKDGAAVKAPEPAAAKSAPATGERS